MVTIEDTQQIITKSPPKACELDPVPTTLLWQHSNTVAPAIQAIVNKSLTMGKFPAVLKQAVLRPLLKKVNLTLTLQNYCPVSNLSFLSKVIERCVCHQLVSFSESSNNMEPLQSAYRTNHSTETALLKVQTDILDAIDNKSVMCLVLLDWSPAFDTVNHSILLNRLKYHFGLGGPKFYNG